MTTQAQTDDTELEVITMTAEDGEEFEFVILGRLELDGAEYAVMAETTQFLSEEKPHNDGDISLYTCAMNTDADGNHTFEPIEDETLSKRVFLKAVRVLEGHKA